MSASKNHFSVECNLRLADTCLVWSHRLSEWCGHGPVIEEDIALTNIALDALGQARLLLQYVGASDGSHRSEDALAYFRDDSGYRNYTIAELPNGDYAHTIVRNLILSARMQAAWEALTHSSDKHLAGIAEKSVKESRYHVRHAADWFIRFGDSTPEARKRIEAALTALWPYATELFEDDDADRANNAAGLGPLPSALKGRWTELLAPILTEATLAIPAATAFVSRGKQGFHSEHLARMLAEMQVLARAHPNATW